jgi:hypothetical protein
LSIGWSDETGDVLMASGTGKCGFCYSPVRRFDARGKPYVYCTPECDMADAKNRISKNNSKNNGSEFVLLTADTISGLHSLINGRKLCHEIKQSLVTREFYVRVLKKVLTRQTDETDT